MIFLANTVVFRGKKRPVLVNTMVCFGKYYGMLRKYFFFLFFFKYGGIFSNIVVFLV